MPVLTLRGAVFAATLALPAVALADIVITDPYARTSRPGAPSGAAFMIIENTGETTDRLLSASSGVSQRVELHTHIDQGDGVMKMVEVEEGFEIEAGASYVLERGGDHVMFMGLNQTLEQGSSVEVTLTFETAGDVIVSIPVDNERKPKHGHGGHGHSDQDATN